MHTPIPPFALADALLFVTTVELGSFTAAAEAHGLTASGMSKAVSRLERGLGVRLLVRTTRTLRLTEEGTLFFEHCREALVGMNRAAELATETGSALRGVLRVGMPAALGARIAMPALRRFLPLHPELSVQHVAMERLADFYALRVDCAIVLGEVDDATLTGRRLGVGTVVAVAAPDYLARRGTPQSPAALAAHDCITRTTAEGRELPWEFAAADGAGRYGVTVHGRVRSDDLFQIIAAALAGLGIARVPQALVARELEQGRLVRLLQAGEVPGPTVWIVYPARRAVPRRVRALVEFLADFPADAGLLDVSLAGMPGAGP